MDTLPPDLLADVLRRLPPRPLAVCRSVSRAVRAVIDARGLLLAVAHLVPRRLRGIFINCSGQDRPYLFSLAPTVPDGAGALDFMHDLTGQPEELLDHRSGLLLYRHLFGTLQVCNPATRRWHTLPRHRFSEHGGNEYLLFDPTVSPHYEVLFFPEVPLKKKREDTTTGMAKEWPPSEHALQVFSSRTGQWEARIFVREGDAAATVAEMWSLPWKRKYNEPRRNAVHWKGAFYVHCRGDFIIRLSLLEEKYQVIRTPASRAFFTRTSADNQDDEDIILSEYLGKSERGVYYTALDRYQLCAWVLCQASEARGIPQWELRHQANLKPLVQRYYEQHLRFDQANNGSWALDRGEDGGHHGWGSDDDTVADAKQVPPGIDNIYMHKTFGGMDLLGYHPFKEIVFLGDHFDGFAYYMGNSKLKYLGSPVRCPQYPVAATLESFMYTPCMDDVLTCGN